MKTPPKKRNKRKGKKLRAHAQLSDAQKSARTIRVRGESHPRAVLSDHDVDLVLELRSHRFTYDELALKFETPKSTIRDICKGLTRARCG